jgi:hypothetical protein
MLHGPRRGVDVNDDISSNVAILLSTRISLKATNRYCVIAHAGYLQ